MVASYASLEAARPPRRSLRFVDAFAAIAAIIAVTEAAAHIALGLFSRDLNAGGATSLIFGLNFPFATLSF